MTTYLTAFVLSAFSSLILTALVRRVALHFELFDMPGEARRVHDRPVPRIGGVAIAIAFFLPVLGLYAVNNTVSQAYLAHTGQVAGLFLGALLLVGLGLYDDLRGVGAKKKFVYQIGVATLAWFLGYQILAIGNPFGAPIHLGWLAYPVTVLWIVAIVNAINLIDGLDGLAGGISLFSVLTLFVVSLPQQSIVVGLTTIALAGALVGFLRHNFNPASIFMGDSGSLFLGYVLAVTSISGASKSSTVVSLLIPVLALGLPLIDTLWAVVRRFLAGRPIFAADRDHIHHRLIDLGYSHRRAVLILYGSCIVLGAGALLLTYANSWQAAAILAAFGLSSIALSRSLGYLSFRVMSQSVRYGLMRQQRLRVHLHEIDSSGRAIQRADSVEEALDELEGLVNAIDVDGVDCHLTLVAEGRVTRYQLEIPREREFSVVGEALHLSEHRMDWRLGDVEVSGRLAFWWQCRADEIQIPESACYQWLAHALRDRALQLASEGSALRLVKPD